MDRVEFVEDYFSRPYHFEFVKGCLPQISLGPFFNTLPQIFLDAMLKIFRWPPHNQLPFNSEYSLWAMLKIASLSLRISIMFSVFSMWWNTFQRLNVLLVARCLLVFARCSLLFAHYSLNFARCSLLVNFHSLLVTFCSLLVTFCSLLVSFYSWLVRFC